MEDTTTVPPRSQMAVVMRYAILNSLITIVYALILYILKLQTSSAAGWLAYLITIILIYMGIKDYRDKDLGGYISFGKALSVGFLIALFTGIIYAVYAYIFFSFIDPHFIDAIIQQSQQRMIDKGMSEDQITMGLKYTKMYTTPIMIALFSILGYAFFGFIIALIEGLILKKDNPEMPQM